MTVESVKPAFTEEEYAKVVNSQLNQRQASVTHKQQLVVPESKQASNETEDDDENGFQMLGDLLTVGKDAAEKTRLMKIQKRSLIKKMTEEKQYFKPFVFYPADSFIKHDPIKTLATLKR